MSEWLDLVKHAWAYDRGTLLCLIAFATLGISSVIVAIVSVAGCSK